MELGNPLARIENVVYEQFPKIFLMEMRPVLVIFHIWHSWATFGLKPMEILVSTMNVVDPSSTSGMS
jgi:hypothetical protein